MKKLVLISMASSVALSACGGGGSSGNVTTIQDPTTPAVNQVPIVASENSDQSAEVGQAFNYDATQAGTTFTDADGDALIYTVSYSPAAQGLSDSGGVISGSPSVEGDIAITITSDDGNGGFASDSFDIVVSPAGTDQNALIAKFAGRIDLDNLENYENQFVPDYILKRNDGGNPISDEGATLGRVLFYDPALSIDDTISCSSCHSQETAFSDRAVVSTGVEGGQTGRHSMRMVNTQFTDATNYFWDNRATSLEDQETHPLVSHVEHGFSGEDGRPTLDDLIVKLEAIEYYQKELKLLELEMSLKNLMLHVFLAITLKN